MIRWEERENFISQLLLNLGRVSSVKELKTLKLNDFHHLKPFGSFDDAFAAQQDKYSLFSMSVYLMDTYAPPKSKNPKSEEYMLSNSWLMVQESFSVSRFKAIMSAYFPNEKPGYKSFLDNQFLLEV
jgi:hypothetical protein